MNLLEEFTIWRMMRNYRKFGHFPPILIDQHGCLIDGAKRVIAARRLGVKISARIIETKSNLVDPNGINTWMD